MKRFIWILNWTDAQTVVQTLTLFLNKLQNNPLIRWEISLFVCISSHKSQWRFNQSTNIKKKNTKKNSKQTLKMYNSTQMENIFYFIYLVLFDLHERWKTLFFFCFTFITVDIDLIWYLNIFFIFFYFSCICLFVRSFFVSFWKTVYFFSI
jgi:hypothetical protein